MSCLCRKMLTQTRFMLNRRYAVKARDLLIELEPEVDEKLNSKQMTIRRHPGIMSAKNISVPERIVEAAKMAIADVPVKNLLSDRDKFLNYLRGRHPPAENWQIKNKRSEIFQKLEDKEAVDITGKSEEEIENIHKKRDMKIDKMLKEQTYLWAPITYTSYNSLQYLVHRAAPEYAVLLRIFKEIDLRLGGYKPKSFFDFGSGVGTGTWAVNHYWKNTLKEYFTVDVSSAMNDLSRTILCDGSSTKKIPLPQYFQRQFLPASSLLKYDVVLSAYSLFELPSAQARLQTILTLWKKTNEFLVLVEQGTNAGFSIINEARDFIVESGEGYVFSPCPHDKPCPRFFNDRTPCNFLATYTGIPFTGATIEMKRELYSYVVLKKGPRPDDVVNWPRVVRPTIVKSGMSICKLCCESGRLDEVNFTKKRHGLNTYQCARTAGWGDLLPVKLTFCPSGETSNKKIKKSGRVDSKDFDNRRNLEGLEDEAIVKDVKGDDEK